MLHKLSNSVIFLIVLGIVGLGFISFIGINLMNDYQNVGEIAELSIIELNIEFPFWIRFMLGIILLGINFWIIRSINGKNRFTENNSLPLVVFYILIISLFPQSIVATTSLLSSTLCLLMLKLGHSIYNQNSVMSLIFWSSILVGIASIIYIPSFTLIVVVLLCISIFRSFNVREYLIAVIGVFLPFFYVYSIGYLLEVNLSTIDFHTDNPSFFTANEINLYSIGIFSVALLSLWVTLKALSSRSKLVVRQRNQILTLMGFILLSVLASMFFPIENFIPFIVAPLALLFLISYQSFSMKWLIDIALLLLFCISFLEKISL